MSRPRTRRERVRWCGGKEGREHKFTGPHPAPDPLNPCRRIEHGSLAVPPKPLIFWLCNHFLRCTACGKKVQWRKPCPSPEARGVPVDPYLKEHP